TARPRWRVVRGVSGWRAPIPRPWRLPRTRRRRARGSRRRECGHMNPDTGRLAWTPATAAALAGTGAVTGLMTGLLGVGGGFIIVPMLRKLTDVPMHGVVATSLMVIALVGTGGIASTIAHGTPVPVEVALWFSATTAAGMVAGRLASRRLAARHVQTGFAVVLTLVAAGLLAKAAFGA
ncbi:sulfite exporter TauE/SafE family protein, partial [Burkholderia sp. Ap-962]|nr:sulfite exporter TauE/SafE family protein [Burkholderia sp. Ap-962]